MFRRLESDVSEVVESTAVVFEEDILDVFGGDLAGVKVEKLDDFIDFFGVSSLYLEIGGHDRPLVDVELDAV